MRDVCVWATEELGLKLPLPHQIRVDSIVLVVVISLEGGWQVH